MQQQRDDFLKEVVNQVGSLAKKRDVMLAHVFDKPESSTNPRLEEGVDTEGPKMPDDFNRGEHSQMPLFTPFKIHKGFHELISRTIISSLAWRFS